MEGAMTEQQAFACTLTSARHGCSSKPPASYAMECPAVRARHTALSGAELEWPDPALQTGDAKGVAAGADDEVGLG